MSFLNYLLRNMVHFIAFAYHMPVIFLMVHPLQLASDNQASPMSFPHPSLLGRNGNLTTLPATLSTLQLCLPGLMTLFFSGDSIASFINSTKFQLNNIKSLLTGSLAAVGVVS